MFELNKDKQGFVKARKWLGNCYVETKTSVEDAEKRIADNESIAIEKDGYVFIGDDGFELSRKTSKKGKK